MRVDWLPFRVLVLLVIVMAVSTMAGSSNQLVLNNVKSALRVSFLPDGRMLTATQRGKLFLSEPLSNGFTKHEYLSLSNINAQSEKGLMDFVLDPDFESNGFLYMYYSPDDFERFQISRFTHIEAQGGTSSYTTLATEKVRHDHVMIKFAVFTSILQVIWVDPDIGYEGCCHYGGTLVFGPDRRLYLTIGDKFKNKTHSQDPFRSAGKIIRLNRDGTAPNDNMGMQDGVGGMVDGMWALGLRNPFRASWDLKSKRFFIGDVGGNSHKKACEDVHLGVAGRNYGWPNCEGTCDNEDFDLTCSCALHDQPLYTYHHAGSGACITGGFVYHGSEKKYVGAYFYADYVRNWYV